jgi:large conductance mechanosensitive channel
MADEEKKGLVAEFKEFIDKGNAMDMAVGVIIGGAFTAIVTALTTNIINPLITVITGGGTDMTGALVVPGTEIDFGAFISACINFLIIAIVVFLMVKGLNSAKDAASKLTKKQEEEAEEAAEPVPTCPFCLEEVKEGATRCPHCAGEFTEPAKAEE